MPERIAARSEPDERRADAPPANWLTVAHLSDASFCRPSRPLRWNAKTSTGMTPSRPDPTHATRAAIGAGFVAARFLRESAGVSHQLETVRSGTRHRAATPIAGPPAFRIGRCPRPAAPIVATAQARATRSGRSDGPSAL